MRFKLSLIFTFIFIITASVAAQEERYIQIVVSDTVSLKPLAFKYQITSSEQSNYMVIPGDTGKPNSVTLDEVDNILTKENFTNRVRGNNFSITSYEKDNPSIVVTVYTHDELEKLYNTIKQLKGITGKISAVDYESPEKYFPEIFERLVAKARSQASLLAQKTGNDIGRVLNVSEVRDMWDGYYETYKQYAKYLPADYFGANLDLSTSYERKLQFKFELK